MATAYAIFSLSSQKVADESLSLTCYDYIIPKSDFRVQPP